MKKLTALFVILLLIACSHDNKTIESRNKDINSEYTELAAPADSVCINLIKTAFEQQNELDGAEFVTVEDIVIKSASLNKKDSTCDINYHVKCSFGTAVRSPGSEQKQAPSVNTDATVQLKLNNGAWCINQELNVFQP